MMLPLQIRTDRLALRPFSLHDAEAVHAYSTSDSAWGRYQRIAVPFTPREAEKFVAELILRDRDIRPTWAITVDGGVVGIVSITFEADHRIAVLGYGVHALHWGKGFCAESARAIIDHSFRQYSQLKRVGADTDARNAGSIRVLQKLGFKHEGTQRSVVYEKGEFVDGAFYAILREEWLADAGTAS